MQTTQSVQINPSADQKQGTWTTYHPNGVLATLKNYDKGIQVGEEKEWDSESNLIKSVDHGNGNRD
jgi:antitoxin component YwqK of YwqJK toxin-antitoxin module